MLRMYNQTRGNCIWEITLRELRLCIDRHEAITPHQKHHINNLFLKPQRIRAGIWLLLGNKAYVKLADRFVFFFNRWPELAFKFFKL